jgi:hypothetical protein
VQFSRAKYLTIIEGNGSAEIAKPIIEVEKEYEKSVEVYDGIKTIEYSFSVTNKKNEEISDVDIEYIIEIVNTESKFPIEYSLYRNDTKIELENNKTKPMILKNSENLKDEYKLNIMWKEKEGEISDNDDVKIIIEAVQKI